jgi:cytochrome c biogenesis factor
VTLVAELALWMALLMAAWTAVVSFIGARLGRRDLMASGEHALVVVAGLILIASAGLCAAILTHDFSIAYVASFTSANTPWPYLLAALWAGAAGSLLLWTLLIAVGAAVVLLKDRARRGAGIAIRTGVAGALLFAMLAVLCTTSNPFARLEWPPLDGRGVNPLMLRPGMAMLPLLFYGGISGVIAPFGGAVTALLTRRFDLSAWEAARGWAVGSWFVLSMALVVGMWSAYVQHGWSGEWVWDATDPALLLPWFAQTLLLRATAIRQRRDIHRAWSVTLALASFPITLLATLVTRRGVFSSIHSFAHESAGRGLLVIIGVTIAVAAYLVTTRWRDLQSIGPSQRPLPESGAQQRRRAGRVLAVAGIAALAAGLAGTARRSQHEARFGPGQSVVVRDPFGRPWTFANQGLSEFDLPNRRVRAIAIQPTMHGVARPLLVSEQRQYVDSHDRDVFEPVIEPGIQSLWSEDVYLLFVTVAPGAREDLQIRITFTPLVVWAWVGGALIALGVLATMWPESARPSDRALGDAAHAPQAVPT